MLFSVKENSQHFATPPLVSLWNEFQGTSTEIQYWWHITIQIWVVLLIGWSKFPMQQDQSEALQYGVSTLVSQTSFHGENQMMAVFSGYVRWCQLCPKQLVISYSASGKSGQIQFLTLHLQSLEHHILVIILQRGEVIMSCCLGSKISGWQQTKKLSLLNYVNLHCYSILFNLSNVGEFSGVDSERTVSKLRKRKKKLLCCVHLPQEAVAWN